ncbi:MAG TPA: DUF4382 domain-containing protein [Gemmatimonadales bacterium]|nr:DUF4382 domain-containing protein [Gemmatimonadales bacterium]
MFRTLSRVVLAGALVLPFAACNDSGGPNGDGRVTLLLTDAPGDVKSAVVTIEQIYLQGEDGRVVLRDEPVTTDLLTLAQDTYLLVDDVLVPEGGYGQLRFVISGGYIEVEDEAGGSEFFASSPEYAGLPAGVVPDGELQMPSYDASGFKVSLPGDLLTVDGTQRILLVDFDVQQSFGHQAGGSGRWVLRPVIKATDVTFAATIMVEVRLGDGVTLPQVNGQDVTLAQASVTLEDGAGGSETLALEDPDGDGVFEASWPWLFPGDYSVSFGEPAGLDLTTDPTFPVAVTLAEGETATVTAVVTGAVAE